MLMFVYSVLLAAAMAAWTLRYLVPMIRARSFPENLRERFGRIPSTLSAPEQGNRTVWLHANSVGELLSASRLIEDLEAALGPGWTIYLSAATPTGLKLAQQRYGAARVFPVPCDFAFALRPYLRYLRPAIVILIEGDVWPRMAHECRAASIPVVVVNARISDRSFRRHPAVRWIWSRRFRAATLWLAQSEEDARRLIDMDADPKAVHIGGNLKYDIRPPSENRMAELTRKAAAGRPILVAGSTIGNPHLGQVSEEALIVEAWTKGALPLNALLVLAPRHPERFAEAWQIARTFPAARATALVDGDPAHLDIILLDTIGDLASVYSVATVAFIGGSLFQHGGHNPLEPAQFGVPIVMGPSSENFRDIVDQLESEDAIRIETGVELDAVFNDLLTHPAEARAQGERGRLVHQQHQGATQRAVTAILQLLSL